MVSPRDAVRELIAEERLGALVTVVEGPDMGTNAVIDHCHISGIVVDGHGNPRCTGIDGVLDQLLYHRGRTDDHFSGRNFVDQLWC